MGEKLKNQRPRIAVVLAGMHAEYAYETLRGIREGALKNNIDIYIFNANIETDETVKHTIGEYNIYSVANFEAFDGIILFANLIQGQSVLNNILARIIKSNVPTVCVDYCDKDFYHVGIENYSAMKSVVSHLIEVHGFTKIDYLSGQEFNTDSQERLKAYCDALKEHGLPVEEKRIFKGAFTNVFGQEATRQILESGEELPQAIVCATDWMALGARSVLMEYGIKIPEQIALTGFDNLFDARNAVPSMTTVDRDMHNVGEAVVDRIVKLYRGEDIPKREYFPSVPVFAESCGCCFNDMNDAVTVRKKYLEFKENFEKKLAVGNTFIEELNDCQSFSEFLKKLKTFISEFESRAFYLCLDADFKKDLEVTDAQDGNGEYNDNLLREGIPERLSVALAYEDGKYVYYGDFDSKNMLPEIQNESDIPHSYIFLPLHFRDYFMGYIVLDGSEFAFTSAVFNAWMLNLSISFESLRKQAHLKSMLQKLDRIYMIDALTRLNNRFGFAKYTADSFERCTKLGGKLMILFADLDKLKTINDVYGHEKGDIAICTVADSLKEACKGNEICARFGGDEYVVYAENYSEADAKEFGKRFERILKEKNKILEQPFEIDASYGYIVVKPKDNESIDKYIDMADNIMYINKKTKKAKRKSKSLSQN